MTWVRLIDILSIQINTSLLQEADKDDSGTVDFFEFVNLMVKRENEKETEDDLKQVFRVFDKVEVDILMLINICVVSGWKWLHFHIGDQVCPHQTGDKFVKRGSAGDGDGSRH